MMLLNDKNPELNEVLTQMKENEGYCPRSLTKDPDTKCPCKEFRETQQGVCPCGAFIKI